MGPLLGRYIWNSVFIATSVTVIAMTVIVPAAYAYARFDFAFKAQPLAVLLSVNMVTGAVLLIPLYKVMRQLSLLNTYWAMIIPGVAFLIPATRFVATFIGQPNMNLVPAVVLGADASGLAVGPDGGLRLTLPVDTGSARKGDRVEVGIRPENAALGDGLHMKVRVLEQLGGVSITYCVMEIGQRFCAALPGDAAVAEGQTISIAVNPADCHIFDAKGNVMRRRMAPALAA